MRTRRQTARRKQQTKWDAGSAGVPRLEQLQHALHHGVEHDLRRGRMLQQHVLLQGAE